MPDQRLQIVSFEFSGKQSREPDVISEEFVSLMRRLPPEYRYSASGPYDYFSGEHGEVRSEEVVAMLDQMTPVLTSRLEGEIRDRLPRRSSVGVTAEMRFTSGSVEVVGYVVLTWLGKIVLDEVQTGLEELVRSSASRVVNGAMRELRAIIGVSLEPMKIEATAIDGETSPAPSAVPGGAASSPAPVLTPASAAPVAAAVQQPNDRSFRRLELIVLILTVLVAFMLIDRFLVISMRPGVGVQGITAGTPAPAPAVAVTRGEQAVTP